MASEKKFCKECAGVLVGRSDKKFCSDWCRNAFNNRQNSDSSSLMRNINNALRRNRRLLETLLTNNNVKVTRQVLVLKGFDFLHHTHIHKTKTGDQYTCSYDVGYRWLDEESCALIKLNEDH